jgi:hypothetical protein
VWMVLCEDDDVSALWVHKGLEHLGLPIVLLLSSELTPSLRWNHRVGPEGAQIEITLTNGRVLHSGSIMGVFNRLHRLPYWCGQSGIPRGDWVYSREELAAFFLSWMGSFKGPVLNRPTPQGLSGRCLHAMEWTAIAAAAGLRVAPYRYSVGQGAVENECDARSESIDVLIIGDKVIGAPNGELLEPYRNLARLAKTGMLSVGLARDKRGRLYLDHATTRPDLPQHGEAALRAIARYLTQESNS